MAQPSVRHKDEHFPCDALSVPAGVRQHCFRFHACVAHRLNAMIRGTVSGAFVPRRPQGFMRIDRLATRERFSGTRDALRSKIIRLVALSEFFIVCSIAGATSAAAHVKWFVNCNVSDDPLPPYVVFMTTFFQFLALFLYCSLSLAWRSALRSARYF
jgi:hypothetical protein